MTGLRLVQYLSCHPPQARSFQVAPGCTQGFGPDAKMPVVGPKAHTKRAACGPLVDHDTRIARAWPAPIELGSVRPRAELGGWFGRARRVRASLAPLSLGLVGPPELPGG